MSAISKHGAQIFHGKKEACNMRENEETPQAGSGEAEEDEIYYLTEKVPYFEKILSESHVNPPWKLQIPKFAYPMFPSTEVPVVLRHGGKSWTVQFFGGSKRPAFDNKWKDFVFDNELKVGDACVFEVIDLNPTKTTVKVFILRGDLTPELEAKLDTLGGGSAS